MSSYQIWNLIYSQISLHSLVVFCPCCVEKLFQTRYRSHIIKFRALSWRWSLVTVVWFVKSLTSAFFFWWLSACPNHPKGSVQLSRLSCSTQPASVFTSCQFIFCNYPNIIGNLQLAAWWGNQGGGCLVGLEKCSLLQQPMVTTPLRLPCGTGTFCALVDLHSCWQISVPGASFQWHASRERLQAMISWVPACILIFQLSHDENLWLGWC